MLAAGGVMLYFTPLKAPRWGIVLVLRD